jgi:tetratricopeptide (TPR) repeat protein
MADSIPPALARAFTALRASRGWGQGELARALGLRGNLLSEYETGHKPLSRERLEELIAPMGLGADDVDLTLFWLDLTDRRASGPLGAPFAPDPRDLRRIRRAAASAGRAAVEATLATLARAWQAREVRRARSRATAELARLRSLPKEDRRLLVEEAEEYRSWALCEATCAASEKAAADDAREALELAQLALLIAERAAGDEAWRARLEGYAWAFLGNAKRVGSDLQGAEDAFARSRARWTTGATAPGPLDVGRLLDLEASLRRDQRQWTEALDLLDRALAATRGPEAAGRILLKKAFTCEQMGDCEEAIEALERAAPLIDRNREPRLIFALRFNLAVNLCHLGRYAEAAPLVAAARELAVALRNDLDLLRVLWLEARVAAGLGRRTEAAAALRQVRRDFAVRGLAYDAALSTLDLAVVLLDEGRAGEVRALAPEALPIFGSLGLQLEALQALRVFWQAEQEAATADLGRRLLRFLERARHDPGLRFDPGSRAGRGTGRRGGP